MSFAELYLHRIRRQQLFGNTVPAEHFIEIQTVNGAKSVDAVNGRERALILDIGQTAEGDGEFVAAAAKGNFLAGLFHIAKCELQTLADPFEFFAGALHVMILAGRPAPWADRYFRNAKVWAERQYIPQGESGQAKSRVFVPNVEQATGGASIENRGGNIGGQRRHLWPAPAGAAALPPRHGNPPDSDAIR